MKFIVDAQLPKSLSDLFKQKGYDSIHPLELPNKNNTSDHEINRIAKQENRVVITKDNDFLETYILKSEPPKLLMVTTGNIPNYRLLEIFNKNLSFIIEKISKNKLIEISKSNIIIHE